MIKKGFTLIELMIVIAIIAIVVVIVLVSLSSAREKSSVATFKTQAGTVRTKAIEACDSLPANNYGTLISALTPLLPTGVTIEAHLGGASIDCGAAYGSGIFDLDVKSSAVPNCVGRARINSVIFTGTAIGC